MPPTIDGLVKQNATFDVLRYSLGIIECTDALNTIEQLEIIHVMQLP
jgi:hypothetical protein